MAQHGRCAQPHRERHRNGARPHPALLPSPSNWGYQPHPQMERTGQGAPEQTVCGEREARQRRASPWVLDAGTVRRRRLSFSRGLLLGNPGVREVGELRDRQ